MGVTMIIALVGLGLALALLLPAGAAAGDEAPRPAASVSPRRVRAVEASPGSIRVDGSGDDAGWRDAPWTAGFVQHHPDEGEPATEATRFKVAHDRTALYLLVEALDSAPREIRGLLTRRDQASSSDWLHVSLDSSDDHRTAFRFSVNPSGVKADALLLADGTEDPSWDAVWDGVVRRGPQGWVAELRIPFSQLRYSSGHATWGIQVSRLLSRRNEQSSFNPQPKGTSYPVSHFGVLDGLAALPRPWRLQLVPYATTGFDRTHGAGAGLWGLGGDGRIGLGPALTLDMTVNPDFGQLEADPSELNLTAYETFLTEKRPFFLQGADIFQDSIGYGDSAAETLFYSRRIGRVPSRDLGLGPGQVRQQPEWTPILAAAKLTGKTSSGWSLGLLDALTGAAWADVVEDGRPRREQVEPLAHVFVARVGKDLRGGQTMIGALATHLLRDPQGGAAGWFPAQAMSGSLGVDHRVGELSLRGKVYGSQLTGTAEALDRIQRSSAHYFQRPDAPWLDYDPTRETLSGWGATLVAGKLSGRTWRAAAGGWARSPGLELNDLGYLPAADRQQIFAWAQLRGDDPGAWHQSWAVDVNGWAGKTFGPELTETGCNASITWQLPGYESLYAGVVRTLERHDVAALRGGPALLVPGHFSGWFGGGTDDRRPWRLALDGSWVVGDAGSRRTFYAALTATIRPTASLELALAPAWERTALGHQYVGLLASEQPGEPARYVVGRLARDTVSLTLRSAWTLSTRFSLQLYLMPYLSAGTYQGFYAVRAPRAPAYGERFAAIANHGGWPERFFFGELRSNLVLRWEYLPGSTLFFVWSHQQTDEQDTAGRLSPLQDSAALLAAPASDVVMLKLAFWSSL